MLFIVLQNTFKKIECVLENQKQHSILYSETKKKNSGRQKSHFFLTTESTQIFFFYNITISDITEIMLLTITPEIKK